MNYENLFQPLEVKKTRFKNRFVMPPMATNMGITSEQALAYYGERARGGVGSVIVEGTEVRRFTSPEFVEGAAKLARRIEAAGAVPLIQLVHGRDFGAEEVDVSGSGDRRPVSKGEIGKMIEDFALAARKAQEAGFYGAEVHGAHQFFFNQFFSPAYNAREDEFGGNLVGRMKLGLETVKEIGKETEKDFLVLYRHTPVWFEGEEGYGLQESIQFVQALKEVGLDIIDISPSADEETETPFGKGAHAGLAGAVRREVNLPLIAVGKMEEAAKAEQALTQGKADLVAVGRGLIADPQLPRKVEEGRPAEIVECIKCNEKCYGNLEKGIAISCTQNPEAGREYQS